MLTKIPYHRSRAFCGVVDALDGLSSDERRRVLGAVLELVPPAAPAAARAPLTRGHAGTVERFALRGAATQAFVRAAALEASAPAARAGSARRKMHCSVCRKGTHDRRNCPDRLKALERARTAAQKALNRSRPAAARAALDPMLT